MDRISHRAVALSFVMLLWLAPSAAFGVSGTQASPVRSHSLQKTKPYLGPRMASLGLVSPAPSGPVKPPLAAGAMVGDSTASRIPVTVAWATDTNGSGFESITGILENDNPQNLTDIQIHVRWLDAAGGEVALTGLSLGPYVLGYVIKAGDGTLNFWNITPAAPPEAVSYEITADGAESAIGPSLMRLVYQGTETGSDGLRSWWYTAYNDRPFSVFFPIASGFEAEGSGGAPTEYLDTSGSMNLMTQDIVPPFGSIEFAARYEALRTPGWNLWADARVETQPRRPGETEVYRFYNVRMGTHFYTASESEWNTVRQTLSAVYRYEGIAYALDQASPACTQTLHRFYNVRTGTHFYTASEAEKTKVQSTLGNVYRYEGPAYLVSPRPVAGGQTVYRFYNVSTGTHFYTASEAEKATVQSTLWRTYRFEGPAFFIVAPPQPTH